MKRMKPWQGACAAAAFFVSAGMTSTVFAADVAGIDNTKWQYNAEDDVYYQTGITYVAKPADTNYETMGIFVPGAYMKATANGDGTYTAKVNKRGKAGSYTAKNAPVVMPVETPGYSAMTPPSGYVSDVSKFTKEGMVYLYAGARGRDHGAPAGVTDMKAAIRYLRQNNKAVPGDKEKLFSFGMSGGGAQSALLGATGDSPLYQPYLDAIGAADGSDAILGSMDWCPITSLDVADEAYEWNMGLTRQNLTPFSVTSYAARSTKRTLPRISRASMHSARPFPYALTCTIRFITCFRPMPVTARRSPRNTGVSVPVSIRGTRHFPRKSTSPSPPHSIRRRTKSILRRSGDSNTFAPNARVTRMTISSRGSSRARRKNKTLFNGICPCGGCRFFMPVRQ